MTHPNQHDDAAIIDALEQALDDGRALPGNGGVPAYAVADYCGLSTSTLSARLAALEEDTLMRVWGFGPNGPETGWLPADHPDARQPGARGALEVTDD